MAQIDRILTSGGEGSPMARCERLHEYQELAGSRLTIIAGGGVDEEVLRLLAQRKVMREVHVGRAAREGQSVDGAVSAGLGPAAAHAPGFCELSAIPRLTIARMC